MTPSVVLPYVQLQHCVMASDHEFLQCAECPDRRAVSSPGPNAAAIGRSSQRAPAAHYIHSSSEAALIGNHLISVCSLHVSVWSHNLDVTHNSPLTMVHTPKPPVNLMIPLQAVSKSFFAMYHSLRTMYILLLWHLYWVLECCDGVYQKWCPLWRNLTTVT